MAVDRTPFPMLLFSCKVEEAEPLFIALKKIGSKQAGDWPLLYGSVGDMRVCLHFSVKDPSHTKGKLLVVANRKPSHKELREWVEELLGPLPPDQKGDDDA